MRNPEQVEEVARTLARATDPETSHEAAEAIIEHLSELQADVLEYFLQAGERGLTDRDLTEHLGYFGESTYRTRRSELTRVGLIVDSGRRRAVLTRSGRAVHHTVWVLARFHRTEPGTDAPPQGKDTRRTAC